MEKKRREDKKGEGRGKPRVASKRGKEEEEERKKEVKGKREESKLFKKDQRALGAYPRQ